MPELGRKYKCYSCHTNFYDLGMPVPLCPKCGADQRDASEQETFAGSRRRHDDADADVEPEGEPVDEEEPEEEEPADEEE